VKTGRKIWILFLWLESVFLLSVAFLSNYLVKIGKVENEQFAQFYAICLGAAAVGLVTASVLMYQNYRAYEGLRKRRSQMNPPVDLDDCFRAAKAFGVQNPIFQDRDLQSEAVSIDTKKVVTPVSSQLVFEHWGGPDVFIEDGRRRFIVSEKNILKLEVDPGKPLVFSLKKNSLNDRTRASGLIHYIKTSDAPV
jgi:hypothetical protein